MKILIVDDEAPARDRLRQMLSDSGEHQVVADAANGEEAIGMAVEKQPDVVLLDIRMPGMDGIEAAHHLNELEHPPAIVFTTAYDQYAIEAFDAQAVGYVLKPVRRQRLQKALAQAARISRTTLTNVALDASMDRQRTQLCARVHGDLRLVPVERVNYFQADQKYTRVSYDGGELLIDDSLKQLEHEFGDRFVRVHRGALVAVERIDSLGKTADGEVSVRLRDSNGTPGESLKVSRRHVAAVKRRLQGELG